VIGNKELSGPYRTPQNEKSLDFVQASEIAKVAHINGADLTGLEDKRGRAAGRSTRGKLTSGGILIESSRSLLLSYSPSINNNSQAPLLKTP
jgi:hypothetical protein